LPCVADDFPVRAKSFRHGDDVLEEFLHGLKQDMLVAWMMHNPG
jgi:hypothetical protein